MLAQIVRTEYKPYKNKEGNYLYATFLDRAEGKAFSVGVFKSEHEAIVSQAEKTGQDVMVVTEKKGNFTNLTDVELAGKHLETTQAEQGDNEPFPEPPEPATRAPVVNEKPSTAPKQTNPPAHLDKDTQIARAVALKCAVELVGRDDEAGLVCSVAEGFEKWLLR